MNSGNVFGEAVIVRYGQQAIDRESGISCLFPKHCLKFHLRHAQRKSCFASQTLRHVSGAQRSSGMNKNKSEDDDDQGDKKKKKLWRPTKSMCHQLSLVCSHVHCRCVSSVLSKQFCFVASKRTLARAFFLPTHLVCPFHVRNVRDSRCNDFDAFPDLHGNVFYIN